MKKIRKDTVLQADAIKGVKVEREILARANHPYLMELHFAFQTDTHWFFCTEYCQGGELFTLLLNNAEKEIDPWSEKRVAFYAS